MLLEVDRQLAVVLCRGEGGLVAVQPEVEDRGGREEGEHRCLPRGVRREGVKSSSQ